MKVISQKVAKNNIYRQGTNRVKPATIISLEVYQEIVY